MRPLDWSVLIGCLSLVVGYGIWRERRSNTVTRRAASQEDQSQKEQQQVRQQKIETNVRWAHLSIAVIIVDIALLLLVRLAYIAIPIIVVVTAVLLLAFYPRVKRPGAHV